MSVRNWRARCIGLLGTVLLALTSFSALAPHQARAVVLRPGMDYRLLAREQPVSPQVTPRNDWDLTPQIFTNERYGTGICTRIDGAGALILGTGDCSVFVAHDCPTCANSVILVWSTNPNSDQCLFFDATGARDGVTNSYDLDTCSASPSDIWFSTTNNTWSQWINGGTTHGSYSMWAHTCTGTSCPMYSNGQDGTNPRDHWQAIDFG